MNLCQALAHLLEHILWQSGRPTIRSSASRIMSGPALNRAANQVALDVARWIGG
jgi:hypothetical protein